MLHIATAVAVGAVESVRNLAENTVAALPLPRRPRPATPLDGQVAIVTGGNAGIGYATAKKLAERGATVVLACRSKERGEAAVKELSRVQPLPGCGPPTVEFRQLDLGSLASVRAFARDFNRSGRPLHYLICNAGIMSPPQRLETQDGFEMQYQVNFLSHFLLSHELLAAQRERRARQQRGGFFGRGSKAAGNTAGAPAGTRVALLSSLTHHAGPAQWHDPRSEASYSPFTSYALSKMCNTMTAFELQRRIDRNAHKHGSHDSALSVHPGIVHTELATNFFKQTGSAALPWAQAVARATVDRLFPLILRSPEATADDMLAVVTAPSDKVAGKYFACGHHARAAPFARDEAHCADLWASACRLVGLETHESLA